MERESMMECRHGKLECECRGPQANLPQPLSSGRWDAAGSWEIAVYEERQKALKWARTLSLKDLHWAITTMASDVNAFSLYERKALLEVIALKLGNEIKMQSGCHCQFGSCTLCAETQ